MKIVKFKDGTYGIRRGNWLIGYSFRDMKAFSPSDLWWSINEHVGRCCHGKKEDAEKMYERLTDKGTPIKKGWD